METPRRGQGDAGVSEIVGARIRRCRCVCVSVCLCMHVWAYTCENSFAKWCNLGRSFLLLPPRLEVRFSGSPN